MGRTRDLVVAVVADKLVQYHSYSTNAAHMELSKMDCMSSGVRSKTGESRTDDNPG